MDGLPVEVIGNILSHLGAARDVVVASAACRKFREAVSVISTSYGLEALIRQVTDIVPQTSRSNRNADDFSNKISRRPEHLPWTLGKVLSSCGNCLSYVYRRSLRCLNYMVKTRTCVNILERCGKRRLEHLVIGYTSISSIDPSFQQFPVLQCLTLSPVNISPLDLNNLLSACPKLESLSLCDVDVKLTGFNMELVSTSLKNFYVEGLKGFDQITLEADKLECLFLKSCLFHIFELVREGRLLVSKIDDVSIKELNLGDSTNLLELVDVNASYIASRKFYDMVSKASNLRSLRLWSLKIRGEEEVMELETIAVSFPKLQNLALSS